LANLYKNRRSNDEHFSFLDQAGIATLAGRKFKSRQIDTLRRMAIPFFVNATGHPVVARAGIHGLRKAEVEQKKAWVPKVLRGR
jgi:hypothetical protein